jgi:hypothetical protein
MTLLKKKSESQSSSPYCPSVIHEDLRIHRKQNSNSQTNIAYVELEQNVEYLDERLAK